MTHDHNTPSPQPNVAPSIDDQIDEWHDGTSAESLATQLGMTEAEYRQFVTGTPPAPEKHVAPLTPLETELLTALKRFRDTIIGEVHDKWDEGMRAGKLIVALANPTLPYRRDITEIHEAIAKAEARAALATTEDSENGR